MRANTVLVWLGRKYAKYGAKTWLVDTRADDDYFPASEIIAGRKLRSLQAKMTNEMCSDDYWDRVWIVQEIGKAPKIQVCFGEVEVAWDAFIQQYSWGGPMNLEKQRQEKYVGGHTLRKLLKNHQHAVCKDPRDKIYGFVGLAADARGFPMDYKKSLLEVWKDTMLFANGHGMLLPSDIIHFGRMVTRLLGGSSVATTDQVAQEYASWTGPPLSINYVRDNPTIFTLPAYIAGIIICTGPSPEQIISVIDAEDEWRARLHQNFPDDLGNTYRDNDLLMQVLLDSETADSGVLSFPNPRIRWKSHATFERIIDNHKKERNKQKIRELSVAQQTKSHGPEETKPSVPASESCLYQIKSITRENLYWKMGIAAGAAQAGDLVCWVPDIEKIVIVRMAGDWLQIIGTAVVPKAFCGQGMPKNHADYFCSNEKFELGVDVETVYILMTEGPGRSLRPTRKTPKFPDALLPRQKSALEKAILKTHQVSRCTHVHRSLSTLMSNSQLIT